VQVVLMIYSSFAISAKHPIVYHRRKIFIKISIRYL